uniref:Transposase (putative) gypsy type domain-containing protein n=1 Tax=Helianthus annuus TaxID=4232 RepID=A0A251S152_HELAN
MSHTGRSSIRSVLTERDLESFVEAYKIPERFSPILPGSDDSAECTPNRIVIYTLSFSSCGVRYPLSTFKVDLLRHFRVHFSQLHPLGFMRVVHFELSCVAVSGEPLIPLFCMFNKLISDGDWFTFAKRKDSISPPCYSFMPTSTYPKEWKSRFIFVSAAMIPESPPLRDARRLLKTASQFYLPMRSSSGNVCMRIPQGLLLSPRGSWLWGIKPFLSSQAKSFLRQERFLKVLSKPGTLLPKRRTKKLLLVIKRIPPGSLPVKGSSDDDDDEDLESRLVRKRKAVQASSPKQVPAPRNIRLRLRSASGQKAFPATKAASELPPTRVKGSLSKHLRSSSLISEPLLGSSKAPIEIPTAPSSSRVRDKTPEISVARITPAFEVSPLYATGTSKPSHPGGLVSQSPLAPLVADALPVPYIPRWKITQSTVVGTPETAWDFLAHVVPPSHKFMNSALRSDLFDDQYIMSLCEGFFRGAGMLQRMDELRRECEDLGADLKTSQTIAAELQCWVTDAERKLQEEMGAGAMLEQREGAWARERMALVEEKEELAAELKHQNELDSVSQKDLDAMYAEWG